MFSDPNHPPNPHLVTSTFPKGTTTWDLGSSTGCTAKARSAVTLSRAKPIRTAPLLTSTVQSKEARRCRAKAGESSVLVRSVAFKPGKTLRWDYIVWNFWVWSF